MENFDLETRRKKLYNGLRNKWREKSREYTEKIEQMKIKSEKLFKERSRQYKQKIKIIIQMEIPIIIIIRIRIKQRVIIPKLIK